MEERSQVRLGLPIRRLWPERGGELPPLPWNVGMEDQIGEEGLQTWAVERQDGVVLQLDAEGAKQPDSQMRGGSSGTH